MSAVRTSKLVFLNIVNIAIEIALGAIIAWGLVGVIVPQLPRGIAQQWMLWATAVVATILVMLYMPYGTLKRLRRWWART